MSGDHLSEKQKAELVSIAEKVVADGKGVLAADEISATIGKRLGEIGVENTADNRAKYRGMLFTAQSGDRKLSDFISGIILNDETFRQTSESGETFVEVIKKRGILPGIKLDLGVIPLEGTNGEFTAQGLDNLSERCKEYKMLGAQFAKWRCIYSIRANTPSALTYKVNAGILARYASICQQNGIVPIVEPEVMRDGSHDLETNQKVSELALSYTYNALVEHHVYLEGTLLKPNMVTAGQSCSKTYTAAEIAKATVTALQRTVPVAVPGIVFLSGGQSEEEATQNLDAMNRLKAKKPWKLSFSFARALQASAMKAWQGKADYREAAQTAILRRAEANSQASMGKYDPSKVSDSAKESNYVENHVY